MVEETNNNSLTQVVAQVLSQFASRENVTVDEILSLARQLPIALSGSQNFSMQQDILSSAGKSASVTALPAVAIDKSVTDDTVTCLCCGRSFTMLKRHLKAEHGLTEDQYRTQFGLDDDHPLVAPNYSQRKAEYAKRIGLGKYAREDAPARDAMPPS